MSDIQETIDVGAELSATQVDESVSNTENTEVPSEHGSEALVAEAAPVADAPKVEDKMASKFAALARKEKQIRAEQSKLAAQRKEFEEWKRSQEEGLKPYMSMKERAAKDPGSLLEDLRAVGLDERTIIEKHILKQEPTPEEKQTSILDELRSQIQELKAERQKEVEQAKVTQAELQKKQEERAKENYLNHLNKFVSDKSDDYELIRANGAVSMVYEVMEEHYNKTLQDEGEGVVLSEKEAADMVESYLLEQAKKLIETNKLKSVFQTKTTPTEPKKSTGPSATLSNTSAQQVPSKTERYLSDEEAKAKAVALIRFKS